MAELLRPGASSSKAKAPSQPMASASASQGADGLGLLWALRSARLLRGLAPRPGADHRGLGVGRGDPLHLQGASAL